MIRSGRRYQAGFLEKVHFEQNLKEGDVGFCRQVKDPFVLREDCRSYVGPLNFRIFRPDSSNTAKQALLGFNSDFIGSSGSFK